jgi:hypothetical protein
LVRQGYRAHHFGYEQVIDGWAATESTVIELLRYPPPGRNRRKLGVAGHQ